jgi:hypothetical protein
LIVSTRESRTTRHSDVFSDQFEYPVWVECYTFILMFIQGAVFFCPAVSTVTPILFSTRLSWG